MELVAFFESLPNETVQEVSSHLHYPDYISWRSTSKAFCDCIKKYDTIKSKRALFSVRAYEKEKEFIDLIKKDYNDEDFFSIETSFCKPSSWNSAGRYALDKFILTGDICAIDAISCELLI